MILPQFSDNPFQIKLSFHKLIERYEEIAVSDSGYPGKNAQAILKEIEPHPELRDGITKVEQVKDNAVVISKLLAELFPTALTKNEIKAVSIPYLSLIFNYSERFSQILKDAGDDFDINIRDFDYHQFYIASCCLILNRFYGTNLDFTKPLFYDIPSADGIIRHYRILYNADFIDIIPTESAPTLSKSDIDLLVDNYDDLELWKKTFPIGAWVLKGFALMTLVDVTVENAVSNLKTNLLGIASGPDLQHSLAGIFKSIFKIPDLKIGFTSFDRDEWRFSSKPFGQRVNSYLLPNGKDDDCRTLLCADPYDKLIKEHDYFAVADVDDFIAKTPGSDMGLRFKEQNIRSFILAPVVKNDALLGVLELVSPRPREFNSVNAHKLEIVMPFITDTIDRKVSELQNQIQAVIQNNYTTLHPSVDWKFKREAQNYIHHTMAGLTYSLKEIAFKDVYPLYGQVDIKDSSITRNLSVKTDLLLQLNQLILILEQLGKYQSVETHLIEIRNFVDDLSGDIKADTEQSIQSYIEANVYPLLKADNHLNDHLKALINNYFEQVDQHGGEFYNNRRSYEKTLSLINDKLTGILDERQSEIQQYFPHYFERFKTDGVEHTMYIGASIAPTQAFSHNDLKRLRLWQLMVTAEMEIEHFHLKEALPFHLDVTSLILVFSTPIAIRFRMDEKHFDIDGAYNVRYEVIKKRIDKACILGTEERITRQGKITIVYSKVEEAAEYTHYINILQARGILADHIEHFDVEDLQGVSGLKALRIGVMHKHNLAVLPAFSYHTLYRQLDQNLKPAEI
ncbi:GAF domain-containing protein [Mucilaginibacter boryungensis]|uniref:GAF domain-containing protein n=1 Tax=Mucilaginibacter boryungensis TaxID=768480 RepID=A0ABR9XFM3_9SPHI|nr:GAF domain-containing protein [Mucilaginibacter boryungensis]MBE9666192.1 GAF domain-containing protein [Mucilaginibacter boryungensis]